MAESTLETQLSEYQNQLEQLELGLSVTPEDDPGYAELLQLKSAVQELVQLTEAQLLLEKKSRLLRQIEERDDETGAGGSTHVDASPATQDAAPPLLKSGSLCRVPYRHAWGGFQMFNAMVMSVDSSSYQVYFLTPTHKSMKMCDHFLRGTCRYGDECGLSHGYSVPVDDAQAYEPPDHSKLVHGASCLAEYAADKVWYPAIVQQVTTQEDITLFTVKYRHYHTTANVTPDKVIPSGIDESDSSESDGDDATAHRKDHISELGEPDSDSEDDASRTSNAHKEGYKGEMAEWEHSTKGFGSRMLAKMGYVMGRGLRDGALVMPVKVEVVPPGVSLDYIAELRERKAHKRKKGDLGSENTARPQQQKAPAPNVFDFINTTLGRGAQPAGGSVAEPLLLRKDSKSQKGPVDEKDARKKLFMMQEQLRQVEKRLTAETESLNRNTGRDKLMADHAQSKVNYTQRELQTLKKQIAQGEKALGDGRKGKSLF